MRELYTVSADGNMKIGVLWRVVMKIRKIACKTMIRAKQDEKRVIVLVLIVILVGCIVSEMFRLGLALLSTH